MVRKSSAVVWYSNERDAKSAIVFSTPGMCCVVSGDAWHSSMRNASVRSSFAAIGAFVERSRDAHATVGVLSHQQATCVCARSANCSNTSHWRSSPAISRSEFVIFPCGFASDTMSCWISVGKGTLQTIGGSALFRPNHTPPAPCLEASQ